MKKLNRRQRIYLAYVVATLAVDALAWALDSAWLLPVYLVSLFAIIVILEKIK